MDSFGVALKPNTMPFRISSQCVKNQCSVFWGESVGRSGMCKQIQRNAYSRKNSNSSPRSTARKLTPGVAYSVLMSEISEETTVSGFSIFDDIQKYINFYMNFDSKFYLRLYRLLYSRLQELIRKRLLQSFWVEVLELACFLLPASEPNQR